MDNQARTDLVPIRILAITLGAIFLAEVIAMIIVYLIQPQPYILETLIDSLIMVILFFPVVYYLSYRPLLINIAHRKQVEEALQENNEFLERMFSLTQVFIAYLDVDMNFIRVNRAYAEANQHEPEFFVGKNHFDLFPHPENETIFRGVARTGEPYAIFAKPFEFPEHPEWGVTYWDWTLIPNKDEHGVVTSLVLSLIDVTARRKAELALEESERRFRAIFDQTFHFLALLAPDGKVLEINQTALDFAGLERSQVVGQLAWEALAGNFNRAMQSQIPEIIQQAAQGELVRIEGEMLDAHSETIELDYTVKPVRNGQDEVSILIVEARDISRRIQMEKELKQERERLYLLLNRLPAFVALQSLDYSVRFANEKYYQIFGDPAGLCCYQVMHGRTEPCPDCLLQDVVETGLPQTWEKTYPNGTSFQVYGYPFSDQDNTPVVLELGVDITENKQARAKIEQHAARSMVLAKTLGSILEVGPDYQAVLDKIVRSVVRLIGDGCVIRLVSEDRTTHRAVAFHHTDQQTLEELFLSIFADVQPLDAGVTGHVLLTGKPLCLPELGLDQVEIITATESPTYLDQHNYYSLLCVPLHSGEELIGTLTLFRDLHAQPYTEVDFQFILTLADQAALAIQNARLFEAELIARQTAEILRDASWALTQTIDLGQVMNLFLDYAHRLAPIQWSRVFLLEDERNLSLQASRGRENLDASPTTRYEFERDPLFRELVLQRKTILIVDAHQDPRCAEAKYNESPGRSWLGIPLAAEEEVIGICVLENSSPRIFSELHLQHLEALVAQVTVIIQNAWFFDQVRSGRERLQSLSRRLVEVQESERRYIARELHDEASQVLSSLLVGLRLIERDANDPASVLAGAADLKALTEGVIDNLHRLAMDLRPVSLDYLGLVAALRQHVEALSDRHHLAVEFEAIEIEERLSAETETAIYRIVQEALNNVILHAQATRVDVVLEKRDGKLIVIIEDNGIGFDPLEAAKTDRLGLVGMRERADMLGGVLTVESQPGIGTTLFLEAPYGD